VIDQVARVLSQILNLGVTLLTVCSIKNTIFVILRDLESLKIKSRNVEFGKWMTE